MKIKLPPPSRKILIDPNHGREIGIDLRTGKVIREGKWEDNPKYTQEYTEWLKD